MTPEQRYLLDLQGFLVVEDALSTEELHAARDAMDRLAGGIFGTGPPLPDDWYEGCRKEHTRDLGIHGKDFEGHFKWAWAFDKALERLAVHPAIWPIILELTQGRPQLSGPGERVGVAIFDDVHTQGDAGRFGRKRDGGTQANWHCTAEGGADSQRRESGGYDMAKLQVLADGSLYCTNFIIFPYLDDVYEGDGGLFLVPGSHRGSFNRPRGMKMFDWQGHPAPAPAGALDICPKAGSYVIMTEATTHAATPWTPTDRVRRAFALRYQPHDFPAHKWFGEPGSANEFLPDVITRRLAPESLELIQWRDSHEPLKAITSQAVVQLSPPRAEAQATLPRGQNEESTAKL
jgi:ectoine hydroxylase-related dioxygenase (phytanoyl-CoA dioxygenase family)